MEDRRKEILKYLDNIKKAETEYIESDCDRSVLYGVIKFIRNEYERKLVNRSFSEAKYYKLFLLLFLEKIKQNILFENSLVDIFEREYNDFCSKLYHISSEALRLTDASMSICKSDPIESNSTESVNMTKQRSKRCNYPQKISKILKNWLKENVNHPYPSEAEKAHFCEKTGLDVAQINNWFINARRRILPYIKDKHADN
jgi:homeobox protein TGIF1